MVSHATICAIRFGYGAAGKGARAPESVLEGLANGNNVAGRYPGPSLPDILSLLKVVRTGNKEISDKNMLRARRDAAKDTLKEMSRKSLLTSMARILDTQTPFFERLVWFWADHFTVAPKNPATRPMASVFIDEAVRPNITGRFADLLKAAVTHPAMLDYLDQKASSGPNSRYGRRRNSGLNENLSREILELHTLGVGADYTQKDVRQFAELLTGFTYNLERGFFFRPGMAEPGAETVLGKSYGNGAARYRFVESALEDIAAHPATARHISQKLATHFVSDDPDSDLVASLERAFKTSGGQLGAVYEALLSHPAAWEKPGGKVRQPFDYAGACLTAVGARADDIIKLNKRDYYRLLWRPLKRMGQPFLSAPGPDGWPESAEHWISPQGLANRIGYAFLLARHFETEIESVNAFLEHSLPEIAGPEIRFAARAAETKTDAIALILASSEMNRR